MYRHRHMPSLGILLLLAACSSNSDSDSSDTATSDSDSSDTGGTSGMIDNDSYILVVSYGNTGVHLINHDGDQLHSWSMDRSLANEAKLLDDGRLLATLKVDNPQITFGGYGGMFRMIDVDQSVEWEVSYASDDYISHHDVEYLSNGNIMFPVWERVAAADALEMGFSVNQTIYPDAIIELNPVSGEVVWEWHATDHLVQDYDNTRDNYGVVASNPNKIDINYNSSQSNGDLMHVNGLTLDEDNDLLYLTVNFYSEVWVIDHSTTTEEAATSSGGNYSLGGDLVYRFGNPLAYDNVGDVTLNRVHHPNLLDTGNMLVFGNQVYTDQSEIVEYELSPPYFLFPGEDNEPPVAWTFTDPDLYSSGLGSADRMSNGNTLIGEGRGGTIWEVSSSGEVLWQNTDYETFWRAYSFPYYAPAVIALGL